MPLYIVLLVLGSIIYANLGYVTGKNIAKKLLPRAGNDCDKQFAVLVSIFGGAIWPIFIFSGLEKSAKELPPAKQVEALPPSTDEAQDSAVDVAEKLNALQEKRAELEGKISDLGQQIDELKKDSEVNKVLEFPKRL